MQNARTPAMQNAPFLRDHLRYQCYKDRGSSTPRKHRIPALNHLKSLDDDLLAVALHIFVCCVSQIALVLIVLVSAQIEREATLSSTAVTSRHIIAHARPMRRPAI